MSEGPFRSRTAALLAAAALVSLLALILLLAFGPEVAPVRSSGPDAFSRSALGHEAFVEILRRLDIPVVVSRHDSASRVRHGGVLVLAEPPVERVRDDPEPLRRTLRSAHRALVVLPKRHGSDSRRTPGWIDASFLVPEGDVQTVLDAIAPGAKVSRPDAVAWTVNPYERAPDLPEPQLVRGTGLVPLVASGDGILLAELRSGPGRVLLLSDPDLIATHGVHRGDNAALMVEVLRGLRDDDAVVFDETLHGHGVSSTAWSELFRFPLVLALLHAVVVIALLAWASLGRFGAPGRDPPVHRAGQEALVASTAEMLLRGGHARHVLGRYLDTAIREVAEALHAPAGLDEARRLRWLEEAGRARGARGSPIRLRDEVLALARRRAESAGLLRTALEIRRWKTEILHAPAR